MENEPTKETLYAKAARLRTACIESSISILPVLKEYQKQLNEFYELMRWSSLGCTDEEYEALFHGIIREYENGIDYRLSFLTEFVKKTAELSATNRAAALFSLADGSLKVGTKVYVIDRAQAMNKNGRLYHKKSWRIFEICVAEINFSMEWDSRDNWSPAVLISGGCEELIPGRAVPVLHYCSDIPENHCFRTREEAEQFLKNMEGEGK